MTRVVPPIALSAILAVLAGCGGSGNSQSASETEATTTAPVVTAAPSTTATATSKPKPTTITIRVVGGRPQGGIARPSVKRNTRVVLIFRSDIADEVHLHGYDISRDVAAGRTARIAFVARIPGRFEVELENIGAQVAELTVR